MTHVEGEKINSLKFTNHMLTTFFQTVKLIIHVARMQQILFFLHQLIRYVYFLIEEIPRRSVLNVPILIYLELKYIHQTEQQ